MGFLDEFVVVNTATIGVVLWITCFQRSLNVQKKKMKNRKKLSAVVFVPFKKNTNSVSLTHMSDSKICGHAIYSIVYIISLWYRSISV